MTPPTRSPYSPTLPKWQIAWNSTSLGWLKTCPQLTDFRTYEREQPGVMAYDATAKAYVRALPTSTNPESKTDDRG